MTIENIISLGQIVTQARIKGAFIGFNNKALFPLSNGQYWIQKRYRYWYHYSYMPHITIYILDGSYFLTINNSSEFIEVIKVTDVQETTIVNEFKGWSGDAIFEMSNGQKWKQNEYEYNYFYCYRPEAIIYYALGDYRMLVDGNTISVKRI
jgi:hypothetical protein